MNKTNDTAPAAEATTLEVVESAPKEKKGKTPEQKAAEKEQAKQQAAISVAGAKGSALAVKYAETAVEGLQRVLGKKFVVSNNGLTIADGVTFTEQDAASLVGTLSETTEKETAVRTTINMVLGDALIAIKDAFGPEAGDALIQQVVSERGQSKHTVQECERTMGWVNSVWSREDRPQGLTFSHLLDGKNYTRNRQGDFLIDPDKIKEIFAKAVEGEVVSSGTLADGTPFENRKPWSTSRLREAFSELLPDKQPATPKAAAGPPSESSGEKSDAGDYIAPKGYLYVERNDVVYWDEDLVMDALALKDADGETDTYTIVIDLENMQLLKRNGKRLSVVAQLPPVSAEVEAEEVETMP